MYINEAIKRNHITSGNQAFGRPLLIITYTTCVPELAHRGNIKANEHASQQPTDLHNERYYSRYRVATSRLWYCNGKIKRKGRSEADWEGEREGKKIELWCLFFYFCARENEGLNPLLSPNFPRTFRKLFRGTFKAFSDGKKEGKKRGNREQNGIEFSLRRTFFFFFFLLSFNSKLFF